MPSAVSPISNVSPNNNIANEKCKQIFNAGTAFVGCFASVFPSCQSPAVRGMACQAVKKAVSKTDGLLKAGGANGSRTHDLYDANVSL